MGTNLFDNHITNVDMVMDEVNRYRGVLNMSGNSVGEKSINKRFTVLIEMEGTNVRLIKSRGSQQYFGEKYHAS